MQLGIRPRFRQMDGPHGQVCVVGMLWRGGKRAWGGRRMRCYVRWRIISVWEGKDWGAHVDSGATVTDKRVVCAHTCVPLCRGITDSHKISYTGPKVSHSQSPCPVCNRPSGSRCCMGGQVPYFKEGPLARVSGWSNCCSHIGQAPQLTATMIHSRQSSEADHPPYITI